MNAVEIEEAVSKLAETLFDAEAFPYAFLEAFGNKETTLRRLKSGSTNQSDLGGVLHRNNIHLKVCPEGEVPATLAALRESAATASQKAKFILATDGKSFEAENLVDGETVACDYTDFSDHFGFFLPLAGITTVKQIRKNAFDIKATDRLNRLYIELLKENPDWDTAARRQDLDHFFARLIFCFFAEDKELLITQFLACTPLIERYVGSKELICTPHRFIFTPHSIHPAIAIPKVSSIRREYLPCEVTRATTVVSNLVSVIYDASLWNMALIAFRLHLVWIGTVCGKLKTYFRYSNTLDWNTFPVPALTEQNKADLARCAEDILLAREAHFPATIADLYDPETMPDNLREAHELNDETLERIYIGRRFKNDTERLEKLFELYTRMTAKQPPQKNVQTQNERNRRMSDLILYTSEDGQTRLQLRADGKTIWLTQMEIAELFQTTKHNISIHTKNIFENGELTPEATVKESLTVQISHILIIAVHEGRLRQPPIRRYTQDGSSTRSNSLGMRPMQDRAWQKRGEQYLHCFLSLFRTFLPPQQTGHLTGQIVGRATTRHFSMYML